MQAKNTVRFAVKLKTINPFRRADLSLILLLRQNLSLELSSQTKIVPVCDSADVKTIKFSDKVIKAHEESTVILILYEIKCLDQFWSP